MSFEEGAMCEPLSVAVYVMQRANLVPGQTVCIFGAGVIGLLCMLVAKAFGAERVVITGIQLVIFRKKIKNV